MATSTAAIPSPSASQTMPAKYRNSADQPEHHARGADAGSFTGDTSGTGSEDGGSITGTLIFSDSADGATAPNYTIAVAMAPPTAALPSTKAAYGATRLMATSTAAIPSPSASQTMPAKYRNSADQPEHHARGADAGSFTGDTSGTGSEDGGSITGTLIFSDSADGATAPGYTIALAMAPPTAAHPSTKAAYGATRLMATSTAAIPSPSASQTMPATPKLSRSA